MDYDEDYDYSQDGAEDGSTRFMIAVGRSDSTEAFRNEITAMIPKKNVMVTNVLPLDADSERRRYCAVIVGKMDDEVLEKLHATFERKMFSSEDFTSLDEMQDYVTENYGDDMWGEIQQFPMTLEEAEAYEIFSALFAQGKLVLTRGMLDGSPVAMIAHLIHINMSQKTVPICIMIDEETAKRIKNPLA